MAIAVASNVLRAGASLVTPQPIGCVVGVGTGGAGTWEVAYADGSHDTNAATAGLLELATAGAIGGDPLAGQTVVSNSDINQVQPMQAIGFQSTNAANRFWHCVPILPVGNPNNPPNYRGLAFAMLSTHAAIAGKAAI